MKKTSRYHGPAPWSASRTDRRSQGSRAQIAVVIAIAAGIGILLGGFSVFA